MSYLRTKGIVIKEVKTGEADKIITIFSLKNGKLAAAAKGARRPKSKLAAGTQLLCYSDFVLFKSKDIYRVNACETIESFYPISSDIIKLTYAIHMADIVNDVIQENQPSPRVLHLFLNSLHMLANSRRSPELITRIFEIRLVSLIGFAPLVNGCAICSRENLAKARFSFKMCGLLCGENACIANDPYSMELTAGTVKALRHIIYSKDEHLFSFDVSPQVLDELSGIAKRYLRERLEKNYTTLDLLKSINK